MHLMSQPIVPNQSHAWVLGFGFKEARGRGLRLALKLLVVVFAFGGITALPDALPLASSSVEAAPQTYYSVYYYNRRYPRNVFFYGKYTSAAAARSVAAQISSPVYYAYVTTR